MEVGYSVVWYGKGLQRILTWVCQSSGSGCLMPLATSATETRRLYMFCSKWELNLSYSPWNLVSWTVPVVSRGHSRPSFDSSKEVRGKKGWAFLNVWWILVLQNFAFLYAELLFSSSVLSGCNLMPTWARYAWWKASRDIVCSCVMYQSMHWTIIEMH